MAQPLGKRERSFVVEAEMMVIVAVQGGML
jgi:hypothetical protein